MADIQIDGVTYTTDALCVYRRDDGTGDWQATLNDYYHAVGVSPRMAVLRLGVYLRDVNIAAFYANKHHLDAFMAQFKSNEKEGE